MERSDQSVHQNQLYTLRLQNHWFLRFVLAFTKRDDMMMMITKYLAHSLVIIHWHNSKMCIGIYLILTQMYTLPVFYVKENPINSQLNRHLSTIIIIIV